MEVIGLLFNVFCLAVLSWACVYVAGTKGLNKVLAGVLGVMFGCITLCVYLALNGKDNNESKEETSDKDKTLLTD